jgi:hypothetical protein
VTSLLKESERQDAFRHDDRYKIDKAREEAEMLFRPKMKTADPSLTEPPPADAPARKPRVLRASAPALRREIPKSSTNSNTQVTASVLQCANNDPEQLARARATILEQQHQLRAKLAAIDSEMRAIDAYEAVKNGTRGRSRYRRKR